MGDGVENGREVEEDEGGGLPTVEDGAHVVCGSNGNSFGAMVVLEY